MNQDFWLAMLLIGIGAIGCFLPVLPGPPLAWLGALYFSWRTGFVSPSPFVLGLLLVVTVVGATADWWMGFLGARKGGASLWGQLAATLGALVGFFVLSIPGLIIGSLAGLIATEYYRQREWKLVFKAGAGYLVGYLLAAVVEFVCVVVIAIVFILTARSLAFS